MKKDIEKAKEIVESSDALLICAGAGMGVDSGLPDFRGKEGFWREYPAVKKLGLSFEEMANPQWFEDDPKLAWAFYGHRLHLYRDTKPHEGYHKLLEIAKSKGDYFVVTSNVDGHFEKAGFDPNKIDEIHGSIHHLQCTKPCSDEIWSARDIDIRIDMEHFEATPPLPVCPKCHAFARPNILMFGDWLWLSHREKRQRERFIHFLKKHQNSKIAILEFGAGLAVPTIRNISETVAQKYHAKLIRVNPRDFEVPYDALSLRMGAKEMIEKLYSFSNFMC